MRRRARGVGEAWPVCTAILALSGCVVASTSGTGREGPGAVEVLPPPGYGTLRQEAVSLTLVSRGLQLMVTPLDESVTRVTAPDTYRRLSGLAGVYARSVSGPSTLFLVSFFSEEPAVRFVPEEVQLISHGVRVRPGEISPVTPTWGERRLRQRETETAVYRFDGDVDLESDLVLVYGLEQTSQWAGILPRIRAERARARARAGPGLGAKGPGL